jgi:hypothetical protein
MLQIVKHPIQSLALIALFSTLLSVSCTDKPPSPGISTSHENLDVCPDYGFDASSLCTAIYEHDKGRAPATWGQGRKKWSTMDLNVTFLGGSEKIRKKVIKCSRIWEETCGIRFHFGNKPDADIRIAFQCSGHWSWVGRDNRNVPANKATMNLQLTDWDTEDEVRRVALHEFGHAIGLEHEHQHPQGNIKWNEPVVLKFYKTSQGWDEKETRFQVIDRKSPGNDLVDTGFDPTSIMMYPIPAKLTTDGFSTKINSTLSENDKKWARNVYPPRS